MFGNLKSKIGDVADLKKLSSPQVLTSAAGSRQRSSQHTPGSMTPRSRHSRQASTASLTGLALPLSPPQSPLDHATDTNDRAQELEREISKLRSTLEAQQDAALERLNAKEAEWRAKLQEEKDKVVAATSSLDAAGERERQLRDDVARAAHTTHLTENKLAEAQAKATGLERKVCELQDHLDQLEGLNTQEAAKVKHMLLNTNNELEEAREELRNKTAALQEAEGRLGQVGGLEERLRGLSQDKTDMESHIASLTHKLSALTAKHSALEEAKQEESEHLKSRIATLEQRHAQSHQGETEKVQALIKEREGMERRLEEARQQLNDIKASWSDKITALENQIQHLNANTAEDQADINKLEEERDSLRSEVSALKDEVARVEAEKVKVQGRLEGEVQRLKEDQDTLKWQLDTTVKEKDGEIDELKGQLKSETESLEKTKSELTSQTSTVTSLQATVAGLEDEVGRLKNELTTAEADLVAAQGEARDVRDALEKERGVVASLEKNRDEVQAKLDTTTSEKNKLSNNLDEYVHKVENLETQITTMTEEKNTTTTLIASLEARLKESESECEVLKEQMRSSEADLERRIEESNKDLERRIEESELVAGLRKVLKECEDELAEKKQALKVQGQRVADMKKTIQRELKLSADVTDSMLDQDPRPAPALPPLPGFPGIFPGATNGSDDINGVNKPYLKHVIIKYLTSREHEAVNLTRAVATLLDMTPEEETLLRETLEWKMSWFGSKPNLGKGQSSLTIPPSF